MAVPVSPVKTIEIFALSTEEAALLGSLSSVQAPLTQPDAPCKNGISSKSQFNAAMAREPFAAWLLFILAPLFVSYAASPAFQNFFEAINEDVITLALLLLTGLLGQRLFRPPVPFVASSTVASATASEEEACDSGSLQPSPALRPPLWRWFPPCLVPSWHYQRRRLYFHQVAVRLDQGIRFFGRVVMKVFTVLGCVDDSKPKRMRSRYGLWDFHEARIADRKSRGYLLPTQVIECRSPPEVREQVIRLLGDRRSCAGVVLKPILE